MPMDEDSDPEQDTPAERPGTDGPAVHVWATAGPPCLPAEAAATVEAIVRAVHHGDDARIRILLAALVDVADTEVLLHLRERLANDRGDGQPP
ncbi:hypothetical protein [Streptomyces sp. Isolate_45]|uniref:hypothetical protein n=1 Tax=Streptomyces sp. Isolate_45 TaxID=2950111 RepID=UPI002481D64E|nr:hypothetical protein [Streptomyces sp. Isolate_45]MDA5283597.1 hypothetical protein [Streptomyces sp. Isolate_45]